MLRRGCGFIHCFPGKRSGNTWCWMSSAVLSSSSDFIRALKTNSVFCERISVLLLFCVTSLRSLHKVIMANNTVTVNNNEIVQTEASEESAKLKVSKPGVNSIKLLHVFASVAIVFNL